MFSKSVHICLVSFLFTVFHLKQCEGWDQLNRTPFGMLFPFVSEAAQLNITDLINKTNGTLNSISVLNAWIDKNWVNPPVTTTPKPSNNTTEQYYYYGRLVDKEYARNLSISFLYHREAVKTYIRVLKRTTAILGYFNETEIEKVNELFWRADNYCYHYFSSTERQFMDELKREFEKTHNNVTGAVQLITNALHKFPKIGEKLDWHYDK